MCGYVQEYTPQNRALFWGLQDGTSDHGPDPTGLGWIWVDLGCSASKWGGIRVENDSIRGIRDVPHMCTYVYICVNTAARMVAGVHYGVSMGGKYG